MNMGITLYIRVLKMDGPGFYMKPEFSSLATSASAVSSRGCREEMNAALDMIPGQKGKRGPFVKYQPSW